MTAGARRREGGRFSLRPAVQERLKPPRGAASVGVVAFQKLTFTDSALRSAGP